MAATCNIFVERKDAMGKAKSVTLESGKSWSQKGLAGKHFSQMLGRYAVGSRVLDPGDHADLAALLKAYDTIVPSGEVTKAGSGIAYFEKGVDLDHPGHTVCFFVVRTDGTRIDFSLGRALDAAAAGEKST
jgi:hypothetical protein